MSAYEPNSRHMKKSAAEAHRMLSNTYVKQVFLVCSEMSDNEQRCAIKFCFRHGHNATETFAKLQQAYGNSVLSKAQVFRWFNAFSEGRESIEDEPRSGRPSVSKTAENVVRVRDLSRSDRRLTPPYSPDLSPCAFFLFPKLKNHLKRHHFGTQENIQTAVTDQLKAIPISEFHQCYEERKKRLQRCVASEGSYFEGDNVELRQIYRPIRKRNRRTTAQQVGNQFLAASGKQIFRKTVARLLRGGGLYARRPVVCVPLTRQHRTARLQWCREHHNWTEQDWAFVLFSDESRFILSSDCRRQLIWRESGTAYLPENIQEKYRYRTCSIMMWAGIMINGRTRLHVVVNGTMTG
ncbi:uncharacterized protein TNCV_4788021 [Trichonephila clavipes]|nr:uncharacterized protein TNCV_4788021 [Trichonephila clavipes]